MGELIKWLRHGSYIWTEDGKCQGIMGSEAAAEKVVTCVNQAAAVAGLVDTLKEIVDIHGSCICESIHGPCIRCKARDALAKWEGK